MATKADHGCHCGKGGEQVARQETGSTRMYHVDVWHEQPQRMCHNTIRWNEDQKGYVMEERA